jgi:hypothetical protein
MIHRVTRASAAAVCLAAAIPVAASMSTPAHQGPPPAAHDLKTLQAMTARFAPVEISADVSRLPEGERRALERLVAAARVMDALFLRQVWSGNETLLLELLGDKTPLGQARLHYFLINKGPWSRLDHDAPFIPGVPAKPEGATYYPAGATKEEVATWLESLSPPQKAEATGFFTTIRRAPRGGFAPTPYSVEYQSELARAAELLREAASFTAAPTLKAYLLSRADAFLSNDYYASDVAWMKLDAAIEPTIGPYEVYEDEWFNFKAAFEAFITLRDDAETDKLSRFGARLQDIENNLPVDPRHRNPKLGAMAPIRVVNVVFTAGDANRGVQTAAFNLPNDERIVNEMGSKRVMLKNVQEAKFRMALLPIAKVVLPPAAQAEVSFDAFFTHILMHELLHGLGPHQIKVGARETTVRAELKENYSTVEEAKADVLGLWALQYLADRGQIDKAIERSMYTTFLASAFRSIRFGINEAHGRGVAIQLNAMLDAGAVTVDGEGRFSVEPAKIRTAVETLSREILTLQAAGDHAKAKALLTRLGVLRPEVQRALDRLKDVPVDIEPRFTAAERLAAGVR